MDQLLAISITKIQHIHQQKLTHALLVDRTVTKTTLVAPPFPRSSLHQLIFLRAEEKALFHLDEVKNAVMIDFID